MMTRAGKIVLTLFGLLLGGLLLLVVLFLIGWKSLPKGERDFLLDRDTPAAARIEGAVKQAQAEKRAVAASSRAGEASAIRIVSPSRIEQEVKAGGTVSTPCFEFKVELDSRVIGDGCRVSVSAVAEGRGAVGYFTAEIVNDNPRGMALGPMAQSMLEGIGQAAANARTYRGENPGPYDTSDGKYLGMRRSALAGLEAIELRWGLAKRANVATIDTSCPAPHEGKDCAASPGLEAYRSVKFNGLAALPPDRYFWDGSPQGWLYVTGWEKGFHWKAFGTARSSLRMR